MSDPMSDERLAEIRKREQAAIPGPWFVVDDQRTLKRWINSENGALEVGLGYLGNRTEDEAAFIAYARRDVPDLLAEVEQLRAYMEAEPGEDERLPTDPTHAAHAWASLLRQSRWLHHLLTRQTAEVERLRAELAEARRGKVESQLDRLDDWSGDLAAVVAERDQARADVKALAAEVDQLKAQLEAESAAFYLLRDERDHLAKHAQRIRGRHRPKAIETIDETTGAVTTITVCVECDGIREELSDEAEPILHPCATVRDLDGEEADHV